MIGFVCHGLVSPVGRGTFGIAQKYPKGSPRTPLFPVVLATGGTRTNRPKVALTRNQWAHGAGLRPPVAPLLGAGRRGVNGE